MSGPRKAFCLKLSEMHLAICNDHKQGVMLLRFI